MGKSRMASRVGVAIVLAGAGLASADTLVGVSSRSALLGTDLVDWGSTPAGQTFTSLSTTSQDGLGVTVAQASGMIHRVDQPTGWSGNFANGDHLLWTDAGGPLTITFASPVSAAGAQVETDGLGTFAGILHAYDSGGVDIGDFNFTGLSQPSHDNTAIFIGVRDTAANIKSIQFDVSPEDFAINQLSLDAGAPTPVPLPTSALAGGVVMMGIYWMRRVRFV
jgi:hypothetical protein